MGGGEGEVGRRGRESLPSTGPWIRFTGTTTTINGSTITTIDISNSVAATTAALTTIAGMVAQV